MSAAILPPALSQWERSLITQVAAWPLDIFEDPRRQPRVLTSAAEFKEVLLLGDYLDDVIVLPDGADAVGLSEQECLPGWLTQALDKAPTSILNFLRSIEQEALSTHRAAVEYIDDWGMQREALPRPYPFCLWDTSAPAAPAVERTALMDGHVGAKDALPEAWRDLRQGVIALEGLLARGDLESEQGVYVCELRKLRERKGNAGAATYYGEERSTKSLSLKHARDWLGDDSRWTLYWNCFDDGIFVGGRGSGKGLHVDQVLWSNVGKHWRGYKLLAVWPAGEVSARMVAEFGDAHFRAPLTPKLRAALGEASKVVLLRPGDLFLCSGGVAHTTLSISDELTVTGYESLVTLGGRHVAHFLRTGATCGPDVLDRGVMEAEDLRDLQQGIARRVLELIRHEKKASATSSSNLEAALRGRLAEVAQSLAAHDSIAAHCPPGCLLEAAKALAHPMVPPPWPPGVPLSRGAKRQRGADVS